MRERDKPRLALHLRIAHGRSPDLVRWKLIAVCAAALQGWEKFWPVTYVAADRWEGVEYALSVLGPEHVGYLPGPRDRDSCHAVLNSFLELFLLSRADIIVMNGESTFARFVAIHGELVGVMSRCSFRRPGVGLAHSHTLEVNLTGIVPEG